MRLREILTELDSRSKRTAPDIFNEPIECGFEAEVVWEHIFDNKIHNWGDALELLSDKDLETIRQYAIDEIESKIEGRDIEIDDEEAEALERFIEEERAEHEENEDNEEEFDEEECAERFYDFYDRPDNNYKDIYEDDPRRVIRKTIEEEIEEEYNNNVMKFIKAHVPNFSIKKTINTSKTSRNKLPEFITNEWVLNYSSIKQARNYWAGEHADNYYVDEHGKEHDIDNKSIYKNMWHFVEDGSLRSNKGTGTGIEIISPVYPTINGMFEDMRSFFAWLVENNASGNYSTGLHVTMNMKEKQQNEMNILKLCTLASDENILRDFSRDRDSYTNNVTKEIISSIRYSKISKDMKNFKDIEEIITRNFSNMKYTSVSIRSDNFKSEEGNTLVEFRSAGGHDYIKEENFYKIENAIKHYAICLKASYSDTYYERDYRNLLNRLVYRHAHSKDEYDTDAHGGREVYKTGENVYPFMYLMKNIMSPASYNFYIDRLKDIYDNTDKENYYRSKRVFLRILLQICIDVSVMKTKTKDVHYKIIKRTMKEFGITNFKLSDIDNTLFSDVFGYAMNDNIKTREEFHNMIIDGYNEIFDTSPESLNFIELEVFKDGHVMLNNLMFSVLKNASNNSFLHYFYREHFNFTQNKFINQNRSIIIIPKEHMHLIDLVNDWLGGDWPYKRELWERTIVEEIETRFENIYDSFHLGELRNLMNLNRVHIFDTIGGYQRETLKQMMAKIGVILKFVESPAKDLIPAKNLVGPNGEPFDPAKRTSNQIGENTSIYEQLFNMERL